MQEAAENANRQLERMRVEAAALETEIRELRNSAQAEGQELSKQAQNMRAELEEERLLRTRLDANLREEREKATCHILGMTHTLERECADSCRTRKEAQAAETERDTLRSETENLRAQVHTLQNQAAAATAEQQEAVRKLQSEMGLALEAERAKVERLNSEKAASTLQINGLKARLLSAQVSPITNRGVELDLCLTLL